MIRPMIENAESLEARANLIRLMTANTANTKERHAMKTFFQKRTKQNLSDSPSSDSELSDESDCKHKRHNKKNSHR